MCFFRQRSSLNKNLLRLFKLILEIRIRLG